MLYEYQCDSCGVSLDKARSVSERHLPVDHPQGIECHGVMRKTIKPKLHFVGTSVQEKYFNHALGGAMTDSQARLRAKENGLIEVGNEIPGKHLKPDVSDFSEI